MYKSFFALLKQASKELDSNWILMKQGLKDTPSIENWLCEVLPKESNVGVNPFLYSSGKYTIYHRPITMVLFILALIF